MIDALRLSSNTVGVRSVLKRAGHDHLDAACRKCHNKPETLGHVLGGCVTQKDSVIRRHNEIGGIIESAYTSKYPDSEIFQESTFLTGTGECLKPDLVIKNEGCVVVDYTVRYENGDSLKEAAQEKIDKYEPLKQLLLQAMGGTSFEVLPIVIGSRGIIPKSTLRSLCRLSITEKSTLLTTSMTALRCSLELVNSSLDD